MILVGFRLYHFNMILSLTEKNIFEYSLPGQAPSLQLSDCVGLPEQSLPPLNGAGLLHERVLDLVPSPQVMEHAP